MENFEALLRKNGLRVTEPRRQVFHVLTTASKPLSLPDISLKCKEIDRASVYRTIDTLESIGAVKTVYIGWKKQYELTDFFSPHHHHLRCKVCGDIYHIADEGLEEAIENLAKHEGFELTSHHFEIEGICANCRSADDFIPA